MIHAIRQDVIILPGGRIEIASSELAPGARAEVIVLAEQPAPSETKAKSPRRRAFMRLPIQERRRLLAEQADRMAEQYRRNPALRGLGGGDFVAY